MLSFCEGLSPQLLTADPGVNAHNNLSVGGHWLSSLARDWRADQWCACVCVHPHVFGFYTASAEPLNQVCLFCKYWSFEGIRLVSDTQLTSLAFSMTQWNGELQFSSMGTRLVWAFQKLWLLASRCVGVIFFYCISDSVMFPFSLSFSFPSLSSASSFFFFFIALTHIHCTYPHHP